jgi:POT family proton-dependent oligopeptide transporter
VNFLIQNPDGSSKLAGADYYWFFTLLMLGTALLFTLVVRYYRGATYIHQEQPATSPAGEALASSE